TVFREPTYPFDYPIRSLTMEEMLAKFIDEGRREHKEMEIFIKEFRTTNKLLLKTRSNLLSELKIEVNELSKVVSNVLIPKNEVNGVTTRGGMMTSKVTRSKEINETRINKNEPIRFEQDVQEKPHDDGVENKPSSIPERTTQPLVKPQQSSIPFPNQFTENKSRLEEACTEIMNKRRSAVLLNELPSKEKDPRSFTTPCQVFEKPKKAEDLVTDHLSRFQNPQMNVLTEREITDKFFDEHLMEKPHDDCVENKSSSIPERTTQPLVNPQQSSIPFPNWVRKEKEEARQRKFLENLKQLDINISFIEALMQIPKYAKYLKSLLTNKSRLKEACTETMNERCSTVLLNKLPLKEKDPKSFIIPCQVLEKHKEAEDLATYHLSKFENSHMEVLTEREIADKFPDDNLMLLKSKFNNDEP
ncbi:hypothetical protein Tco_1267972, partial [Tanacetum coccineum]